MRIMLGLLHLSSRRNTTKVKAFIVSSKQIVICDRSLFLVIEAGLILQLDCPDLAMGRHHAYSKYDSNQN